MPEADAGKEPPKPADGPPPDAAGGDGEDRRSSFATEAPAQSQAQRTRKAWLKSARKVFDEFDADGGGSIDLDEFAGLLESSGLNFSKADIDRMCQEFDTNGDGEIDFQEFTTYIEAQGMGPGATGTSGFSLTDALRAINNKMKQTMTMSEEEKAAIECGVHARCPKSHILEKFSIGELALEKFFFGLGGFICETCDIHSENLVNKSSYYCPECQYTICSMCAGLARKEALDSELKKRDKMQGLWAFSEAGRKTKANENVVHRGKNKVGTSLKFAGGGMRMSITLPQEPTQE